MEQRYVDLVASVKAAIAIPLSVKIGPYFTSLPHLAKQLIHAGADGLVIFNRYLHPDIDLNTLELTTRLSASSSDSICLPLRWIGILRGTMPDVSLAATSGTRTREHIVKMLLAGADVTMIARELLRSGPEVVTRLVDGIRDWLEEREYTSVRQMKGSMSAVGRACADSYERANYMSALVNYAIPDSASASTTSVSKNATTDLD